MSEKRIAYITPINGNKIATFSKSHYERIEGNVFLYHGLNLSSNIIPQKKIKTRFLYLKDRIRRFLRFPSSFSIEEQLLIHSFKEKKID